MSKTVLITGAAGFIGSAVSEICNQRGFKVVGIDNYNTYYDPALKVKRVECVFSKQGVFIEHDLMDKAFLLNVFKQHQPDVVIHLAACAGVRHSIEQPYAYLDNNVGVFLNMLEACRRFPVGHFLYASSSSVYGGVKQLPFSTQCDTRFPISFYAATKACNEAMAHSYSHLYKIPTTGLRFFTVYGPWGRPDMAIFLFTKAILNQQPLSLFNNGQHRRDFTYIDDIAQSIFYLMDHAPGASENNSPTQAAYRVLNIGRGKSVELLDVVRLLETQLKKKAIVEYQPMQAGDIYESLADVSELEALIHYKPTTDFSVGIERFVAWYQDYYGLKSA